MTSLSVDHQLRLVQSLRCLARTLGDHGEHDKALRLCWRAMRIASEAAGYDHGEVAAIYEDLADLELSRGRVETSARHARTATGIRARAEAFTASYV